MPRFDKVFPHVPISADRILFFPCQCPYFSSRHCKSGRSANAVTQPVTAVDFAFDFQQFQLWGSRRCGSFMWNLSWELESLSSSFSFTTLSSNISSNQEISLYVWLFWKCLYHSINVCIIYTNTEFLLSCVQLSRSIHGDILHMSIDRLLPRLSVLCSVYHYRK